MSIAWGSMPVKARHGHAVSLWVAQVTTGDPEGLPEIDPDDPVFQFVAGVIDIIYAPGVEHASAFDNPGMLRQRIAALLGERPAPPRDISMSAEEQAERLIAAAWEAGEEAPVLAVDALRLWPGCANAYTFLGVSAGGELSLAIPMFTLAVMAAYEHLGPEIFGHGAGSFWTIEETKPFMRALGELARANRDAGATEVAVAHYQELLRLNQADDQGARYELLAIFLDQGDTAAAGAVLAAFSEEDSPPFAYGAALAAFQAAGDGPEARAKLAHATLGSPAVAPYLAGLKPMPEDDAEVYQMGGEDEAILFADLLLPAWQATENAVDWLRAHISTVPGAPAKPPAKVRRTGPRQAG